MLGSATTQHFVFNSPARFEGGRGYSWDEQYLDIRAASNRNCGNRLSADGRFALRLNGRSALLSNFATSNDSVWIRAHCGLGMSLSIRARQHNIVAVTLTWVLILMLRRLRNSQITFGNTRRINIRPRKQPEVALIGGFFNFSAVKSSRRSRIK